MSFARSVERVLESMVDRFAGRVFPGALPPAELAGRVIRAVDLEVTQEPLGPGAPNVVEVRLHPGDVDADLGTDVLGAALGSAFEDEAALRGWRLEGPAEIRLVADDAVPKGRPAIRTGRRPGPRPPWGMLAAPETEYLLTDNRVLVGRSDAADVQILDDSVSRSHALVWRQAGSIRIRDLGSSNGTTVNGTRVAGDATITEGDVVGFGDVPARMTST